MKMRPVLTKSDFDKYLTYDPDTGVFIRKINYQGVRAGSIAGTVCRRGYVTICVNYHFYKAHQLAFLAMTGIYPDFLIDHINRNPSDNRFSNLRKVTMMESGRNRKRPRTNTSGFIGVSPVGRRWRATMCIKKKTRHIGYFRTPEEAALARDKTVHLIDPEHYTLNFPNQMEVNKP